MSGVKGELGSESVSSVRDDQATVSASISSVTEGESDPWCHAEL